MCPVSPAGSTRKKPLKESLNSLILFNDDHNTFDHVIECLIEVCEHTPEQAEQCAMITHFNGRCVIKESSRKELLPFHQALTGRGLTTEIK